MPCNNLNSNLGGQNMGGQANMNSSIMNGPINSSSISNSPINSSINSSASSTPNLNTAPSGGQLTNANAGNLNSMNCKMQPPLNNQMNSGMGPNPNMGQPLPGMAANQMVSMANNLNNMNMNSSLNNPGGGGPPNNLNSLNVKNSNNKFDSQYVQSNLVYVFSTQLANEAADAVQSQKADNIISYHASLERTQKFMDENLLKNQPSQQLPNWPPSNKRNKQSPCSMNGQPNNQNSQNNSMSPYAYRPPSNSSVVSNASYRPGPSPGIPNDLNWNGPPGNEIGWQSPQHPNSTGNFINNPNNMRPSMNSNQMMPNNGSGGYPLKRFAFNASLCFFRCGKFSRAFLLSFLSVFVFFFVSLFFSLFYHLSVLFFVQILNLKFRPIRMWWWTLILFLAFVCFRLNLLRRLACLRLERFATEGWLLTTGCS